MSLLEKKWRVWLCSELCGRVILVTCWLDITNLKGWLGIILWVWLSSISNIFAKIHFHDQVEIILINMMHHKHFLVALLTRETCCAALPYTFKLAARPHHSFSVNSAKWPKPQAVAAVVEWVVVLLHCEVLTSCRGYLVLYLYIYIELPGQLKISQMSDWLHYDYRCQMAKVMMMTKAESESLSSYNSEEEKHIEVDILHLWISSCM